MTYKTVQDLAHPTAIPPRAIFVKKKYQLSKKERSNTSKHAMSFKERDPTTSNFYITVTIQSSQKPIRRLQTYFISPFYTKQIYIRYDSFTISLGMYVTNIVELWAVLLKSLNLFYLCFSLLMCCLVWGMSGSDLYLDVVTLSILFDI